MMSFDNAQMAGMDSSVMIEDDERVIFKSPFLIDKHLQRDEIAFEYFTLVQHHHDTKSANIHGTGESDQISMMSAYD
jgi:outer membrane protein W